MIDYFNNVESEYHGIRRTLRTAATNHVILRHLYRCLPEESETIRSEYRYCVTVLKQAGSE